MKKMSLYSCLFNNADSYYLFNTETMMKAKISHALYKDLKNCNFEGIDSKLLKILEEKKFIVEEEKSFFETGGYDRQQVKLLSTMVVEID